MSVRAATRREIALLGAVLFLGALPALFAPDAIAKAAALVGEIQAGSEYGAAGHVGLVYGIGPLVTLSSFVLVLAPGLFVAIMFGRSRTVSEWILAGFTISLVLVSVVSGAVQAVVGDALRGTGYAAVLVAISGGVFVSLMRRAGRPSYAWPLSAAGAQRDLLVLLLVVLACYFLFVPKLFWDSFNGDGAHAYESSRLLLRHALPFWPEGSGPVGGFPGTTSMLYAFPNAWFLRLFGEVEVAARLPFLLYLPVLLCAVRELARVGREEVVVSNVVVGALALGVMAYALAMGFSATYNPYSADLALPATQDTLLMIVYLGALAASLRRAWGWLAAFVVLTYLSLPSGLILIGFWLVARVLAERPVPWRDVVTMGAMLFGTMVVAGLLPTMLDAVGAARPGGEYGVVGILRYFAFLQFTDVSRLLLVAIPAGLFPIVACVMRRPRDPVANALALVTLAYFLFFFVQAHVSLHHFVPAMVLPMVVALRRVAAAERPVLLQAAWLAAAAVAVLLAWPWNGMSIHRDGREVGTRVAVTIPGYEESATSVMQASSLLDRVFPYDWDPAVPAAYGGSPLVWNHYALHAPAPSSGTNYLVQPTDAPAPQGWRLAGRDSTGASIFVRDEAVLAADRARRPRSPAGSPFLEIPRGVLFHGVPLEGRGPHIIDVVATLESWGLDLDPLLKRLGVERDS